MRLIKRFGFSSAHFLPNYVGNCNRIHGHQWTCELTVAGQYDEQSGMICDFKKLKQLINANVVSILDHNLLNDIMENPTAENIVVWIFDALCDDLDRVGLAIAKIRLWESDDSSVEFDPIEEMMQLEYDKENE